ncbi:hypothetical protein [Antarctobacter sp.]|uniref:hypothetical protein n=1 Tax=Antarctobacter sp. TaxID=1872577 RepID=UPI003A9154A1
MPRLILVLIATAFLLWGASPAMAGHGGVMMECAADCMDCAAADDAARGHDVACAACPAIGSVLPCVLALSGPEGHRGMFDLPGRLLVAEPALAFDPPPPRV